MDDELEIEFVYQCTHSLGEGVEGLVVAATALAHQCRKAVHSLLQQTQVRKTYHAVTFGGPATEEGTIDAPIGRRPLPSLLRCVSEEGKPSVTEYKVLEWLGNLCKLELRPITGRTHQLRVHCAYMGYPILGDPQYGSEESKAFSKELGIPHQLLCAKSLELTHPITGEKLRLMSEMEINNYKFNISNGICRSGEFSLLQR